MRALQPIHNHASARPHHMSLLKKLTPSIATDIQPLLSKQRGLSLVWSHVGRGFLVPCGGKIATMKSEDGIQFPITARHNLRVLGTPFDAIVRKGIVELHTVIKFDEDELLFETQRMPEDCMEDATRTRLERLRRAAENASTRHLQFSRGLCSYDLTMLMSKLRNGVVEPDALRNPGDIDALLAARLGASDEELLKRVVRSLASGKSSLMAPRAPCV